ncbi:cation-translocating P-type ATPase [Modestobacter marinus]|uniref:Cation-transporting ATPase E n=1 Tax=Modestobacter marinus TaxID=477641 RepID=A0A846M3W2_9ACTN|nr:HAD-IC family P-type ATPase [Modestobacter marinus]NIH69180.1 cation-transporting ATPase E [Modestobacter marinus]GGL76873.1 putative cation-transporting ATPase E [Modestobacter marinus]
MAAVVSDVPGRPSGGPQRERTGCTRPDTPPAGLSAPDVAARVAAGQTNATTARNSRTVVEIVRTNVLTFFNGLLAVLFVLVAMTGRWQNGLFGGVVLANAAIGIVQELRAKRTLDRLAVLNAPRARVLRDSAESDVPVADVVLDDLLCVTAGDQLAADGVVRRCTGLTIDESLLTGESEPVVKQVGDPAMSGSIVVAGHGVVQATAVGDDSYAARLATDARRFTTAHSELVTATGRLLRWISLVLLVVGPAVLWSQFRATDNVSWQDAVTGTVAALVGMIPEGLVLLTTLAFGVGAVTLARRQTLVQELPAVEGLARVDVVCLDKTGTLTHGDVRFDELIALDPAAEEAPAAVGVLVAADPANATAAALAAAFPAPGPRPLDVVPFSSARKWSAVRTADAVTWALGAPEMVLPAPGPGAQQAARARADDLAAQGRRVLLLARSPAPWPADAGEARLPPDLVPVALVVLVEHLREDAAEVLRYFTDQGVALKVVSGDNPRTVGAVAAAVGVPGVTGAADAVDARTLPEDVAALAQVMEDRSAFGRVTPHQKRAMVAALQERGHVVAMTGDGVNDALALKDADIGVAMGNGSPATRAVAQLVLLDGRFAHLPEAVAEGRRVIANIERAASLFLVKNVYSLVLALIAVATLGAYPFAPVQLTLISTLTIGVPGFVLALAPNRRRYVPGFLRRVLTFSLPTGAVIGCTAYAGFAVTRWLVPDTGTAGARTAATVVVLVVALWTLGILARPLTTAKAGLLTAMTAVAVLSVAVPDVARSLVLLEVTAPSLGIGLAVGVTGALLVEVVHRCVPSSTAPGEAVPARRQRVRGGTAVTTSGAHEVVTADGRPDPAGTAARRAGEC